MRGYMSMCSHKLAIYLSIAEIADTPENCNVQVSRKITAKSISVQKKLYAPYHDSITLRDTLLVAVDIFAIQTSLKSRMFRTAQQLENRVASRPLYIRRTACSAANLYASQMVCKITIIQFVLLARVVVEYQ